MFLHTGYSYILQIAYVVNSGHMRQMCHYRLCQQCSLVLKHVGQSLAGNILYLYSLFICFFFIAVDCVSTCWSVK